MESNSADRNDMSIDTGASGAISTDDTSSPTVVQSTSRINLALWVFGAVIAIVGSLIAFSFVTDGVKNWANPDQETIQLPTQTSPSSEQPPVPATQETDTQGVEPQETGVPETGARETEAQEAGVPETEAQE